MNVSIRLLESDIQIARKLNNVAIRKLLRAFSSVSVVSQIQSIVQSYVITAIKETRVWQSLLNGGKEGLDAHFGIPRGQLQDRLTNILDIWSKEIIVKPQNVKRRPRTFAISYKFYAIRSDWSAVLASPAGITINNSRKNKGQSLPWLQWLLVDGDRLVISEYQIDFNNYPKSRSGKAYMKPGLSWQVPPEYGPFNINNNFITIAMNELAQNKNFRKEIANIFNSVSFNKSTVNDITLDVTSFI